MKLYYSPGVCSLSPHIAAREAGIPIELKKVDLATKTIEGGGDYLQVNPKGYVPALELPNGVVLTEGPAIVQYLADQNADAKIAPKAGTLERYQLQEWLTFIGTEIHKKFGTLFDKSATPEWKAQVVTNLGKTLDIVASKLQGKQYVLGESFTVADGYLFTVLNWTKHVNVDLGKWPVLTEFQARIGARPKVQEAMKAEGLIK
ncbi:MAG TPA: glutathione transferase GstA [Steroidobacteraceae bacterium]|nr:glutathione transferase GstA [Steroidobacteraceae bacterium]